MRVFWMGRTMPDPKNILVAQTIYLGDLILTLPLLNVLRQVFPGSRIDVLVRADLADVVSSLPVVRNVIGMDKEGEHSGVTGLRRLVHSIRKREYDLAIVMPGSMRTAMVPLLAGIPRRIGWDPGTTFSGQMQHLKFPAAMRELPFVRSILCIEFLYRLSLPVRKILPPLFTQTLPASPLQTTPEVANSISDNEVDTSSGWHASRRWMEVLRALSRPLPTSVPIPWLPIPKAIQNDIAVRFPSDRNRDVVLAPGAAQPTRRWSEENFKSLAQRLGADGFTVFVIGGELDIKVCARIARQDGPEPVVSLAGLLSPLEAMALIGRCCVVVANDSAPVHMASAMGTPTVALFGPTVPEFGFGPLAPRSMVMQRTGLSCRPCTLYGSRGCPIVTHECLAAITVDEVYEAVLNLVNSDLEG
jgi:heptosyltransferase-2